jgi:hypothetical protein
MQNGRAAYATAQLSRPVIDWRTNRLKPTGGVTLCHLDDQHDEDPEPDQIEAGFLDERQDDGHRQVIINMPSRNMPSTT